MYEALYEPYQSNDNPSLNLGGIILGGQLLPDAPVNLILKSFNRHGLMVQFSMGPDL